VFFKSLKERVVCMAACSLRNKVIASFLGALTIIVLLPLAFGDMPNGLPIGKTASSGIVSIAGSTAPSGTVVFSGERVVAQDSPALISFRQGGSILLGEGAGAKFSRNGDLLLIQADSGTMSFNLPPGEKVRIQAGSRSYVSSESGSVGEITVAPNGESALSVASGKLYALNTATSGTQTQENKKGNLTKGGNSFSDPNANWKPDELVNRNLKINGKPFTIVSNTEKTIKIKETFSLDTGVYVYSISEPPVIGKSRTKLYIAAGAGAGAAAGIIAWQASKSGS
jgi:hypothetical protein